MSAERIKPVDVDPGPAPAPEYPALPIVDGVLVLDELEAWHVACRYHGAELAAARVEGADVMACLDSYDRRSHDVAWVSGWMGGRLAGAVCDDEVAWHPTTTPAQETGALAPPGYLEGWAAGLAASARRLDALGRPDDATLRRSVAELVALVGAP